MIVAFPFRSPSREPLSGWLGTESKPPLAPDLETAENTSSPVTNGEEISSCPFIRQMPRCQESPDQCAYAFLEAIAVYRGREPAFGHGPGLPEVSMGTTLYPDCQSRYLSLRNRLRLWSLCHSGGFFPDLYGETVSPHPRKMCQFLLRRLRSGYGEGHLNGAFQLTGHTVGMLWPYSLPCYVSC